MNSKEETVQLAIIQYLRYVLPNGFIVQHTANNPRSRSKGAREKAMGAIAGWPDLAIYGSRPQPGSSVPWRAPWVGFIEVKGPSTRTPKHQVEMHERLRDMGWPVAVCRSVDDVRETLRSWMIETKEAVR